MKKNVLILGSSGFLGSHLAAALKAAQGISVFCLSQEDLDFLSSNSSVSLSRFIKVNAIDVTVVLSAIKRQNGDSESILQLNNSIVDNIALGLLRAGSSSRIIYVSSLAVYGEKNDQFMISEKSVFAPTSYYGEHKVYAEQRFRNASCNKKVTIVRPPMVYSHLDRSGYTPGAFFASAKEYSEIRLWGDGLEKREFLHVYDFCYIVRLLIDKEFSEALNLCSGVSYSYVSIASYVKELLPCKIYNRERSGAKVNHLYDAGMLFKVLGRLPLISPFDALRFHYYSCCML